MTLAQRMKEAIANKLLNPSEAELLKAARAHRDAWVALEHALQDVEARVIDAAPDELYHAVHRTRDELFDASYKLIDAYPVSPGGRNAPKKAKAAGKKGGSTCCPSR